MQAAKRVSRPRWRDARLALGLLLLLGSVVVGARVVGAADHTVALVTVGSDLPAGHILTPADLGQTRARLVSTAGVYLTADQAGAIAGHRLARPMGKGELLPAAALATVAEVSATRDVPIVIDSLRLPKIRSGDLVDLLVTAKPTQPGVKATVTTVGTRLEVIGDVPTREGSSGKMRVVLRVPIELVSSVIKASELGDVDLVSYIVSGRS